MVYDVRSHAVILVSLVSIRHVCRRGGGGGRLIIRPSVHILLGNKSLLSFFTFYSYFGHGKTPYATTSSNPSVMIGSF